jgi:hypothetical protein
MKKESKYLLPAIAASNAPVAQEKPTSRAHVAHHANIKRHVIGLKKHYSKKEMEKQLQLLMSVNHMQMLPRG